ncbi:hypothetical protein DUPY_51160 [Duganella phyllosphaerae]|uniref:Uncharacterized protein n=2 Tax=Duganella phyllosphaerae TaxID=762836 RepID=A0A1E7W679_9BURK|nr:hypothetical protein DUPY_51160 [Duganella phyllosphaerae]
MRASNTYSEGRPTAEGLRSRFPTFDDYSDVDNLTVHTRPGGVSSTHENFNEPMSNLTREEFDAKLETIEVKMDGRVASIQASVDNYLKLQTESAKRLEDRLIRMESDVSDGRKETKAEGDKASADMKSLKTAIIVTAVSTVAAILFGVLSFNTMLTSNMLASFESGKNTASAQEEVKKQAEDTAALLKQMREELDRRRQPDAPPSK